MFCYAPHMEASEPVTQDHTPAPRVWKLERAAVRIPLIRDLAEGILQVEAAAKYEVGQPAIAHFVRRHSAEIEHVRANLEDVYAGIWIAEKAERLKRYAADVEAIDSLHDGSLATYAGLGGVDAEGEPLPIPLVPSLLMAKHRALRNTGEELGALRTVIDHDVHVRHELVGVDPADLT